MHLGLIGGIGPAATVFYYQRLVRAFDKAGQHLELTIAHTSAQTLSGNAATDNVAGQVDEFLRVSRQLAAAGAERLVITSMGGHFCADAFAPLAPLPLLHGPTAVGDFLRANGARRIGVLGTRIVMQTGLYGALADLEPLAPLGGSLMQVNDDYVAIAIAGKAEDAERERLVAAGKALVDEQGAEVVLLGGTDLNLVYSGDELDVPVVDSAAVHVDAIVSAALASP
ncbi:MAG: aspartate/glutamate racemase family protein [Pseudomonadota bacterium]